MVLSIGGRLQATTESAMTKKATRLIRRKIIDELDPGAWREKGRDPTSRASDIDQPNECVARLHARVVTRPDTQLEQIVYFGDVADPQTSGEFSRTSRAYTSRRINPNSARRTLTFFASSIGATSRVFPAAHSSCWPYS